MNKKSGLKWWLHVLAVAAIYGLIQAFFAFIDMTREWAWWLNTPITILAVTILLVGIQYILQFWEPARERLSMWITVRLTLVAATIVSLLLLLPRVWSAIM